MHYQVGPCGNGKLANADDAERDEQTDRLEHARNTAWRYSHAAHQMQVSAGCIICAWCVCVCVSPTTVSDRRRLPIRVCIQYASPIFMIHPAAQLRSCIHHLPPPPCRLRPARRLRCSCTSAVASATKSPLTTSRSKVCLIAVAVTTRSDALLRERDGWRGKDRQEREREDMGEKIKTKKDPIIPGTYPT